MKTKFQQRWYTTLALIWLTCSFVQAQEIQEPEPGLMPPMVISMPLNCVPAFPGAWGGGMYTTGGRGGDVIAVTNLNDSGPGSLRAAIEAEGARIVIFRVAGIIRLKSDLTIKNPDITIAGQSAPGDGVCIANYSLNLNTHNVILRHLRVRRGNPSGGQGSDNIGGYPTGQIMVDHCTASWGRDENLSLYRYKDPPTLYKGKKLEVKRPVKNLTVQYCISSEALGPGHEFGGTWGGQDATFHHNLLACNTGRNPSIGMSGKFDYRNNVVFNWGYRIMDGGDETSLVNIINNYYKPGPGTRQEMRRVIAKMEQRNMYSPDNKFGDGNWYPKSDRRPGKWYVAGNILDGQPDITADNWKGMILDNQGRPGHQDSIEAAKVILPFDGWPVMQQTALEAYQTVLAKAGATLPRRDAVDIRVIKMVRTGKTTDSDGDGFLQDPEQVGGYPEYKSSPSDIPADQDNDGMPDEWEKKYQLNAGSAADNRMDTDGDGYTNIEEFLNGTNPQEKVDYLNLANNVDTIS